jgi:nitronate monooxygenase
MHILCENSHSLFIISEPLSTIWNMANDSHGLRRELGNGTLSLTNRLVKIAHARKRKVPVLAAGGVMDGNCLVSVLSLGADGAVLGTRLWASVEASGPKAYKTALVKASSCDDVIRTQVFDVINNSFRPTQWPAPYDSSGVLRNDLTNEWDSRLSELNHDLSHPQNGHDVAKAFRKAEEDHRTSLACVYGGQGVGEIDAIEPAYDIVKRIEKEAVEALTKLQAVFLPS